MLFKFKANLEKMNKMFRFNINHSSYRYSYSLVYWLVIISRLDFCECTTSTEDDEYEELQTEENGRFRTMYAALMLGGVFILLLSFVACCFFCHLECSFCCFPKLRLRRTCPEISEVEPSAASYSNDDRLCQSENFNSPGIQNPLNILDPPPPYPGKRMNSNPAVIYQIEEYPPPPYTTSFSKSAI